MTSACLRAAVNSAPILLPISYLRISFFILKTDIVYSNYLQVLSFTSRYLNPLIIQPLNKLVLCILKSKAQPLPKFSLCLLHLIKHLSINIRLFVTGCYVLGEVFDVLFNYFKIPNSIPLILCTQKTGSSLIRIQSIKLAKRSYYKTKL